MHHKWTLLRVNIVNLSIDSSNSSIQPLEQSSACSIQYMNEGVQRLNHQFIVFIEKQSKQWRMNAVFIEYSHMHVPRFTKSSQPSSKLHPSMHSHTAINVSPCEPYAVTCHSRYTCTNEWNQVFWQCLSMNAINVLHRCDDQPLVVAYRGYMDAGMYEI
jgi:hypothetical protein